MPPRGKRKAADPSEVAKKVPVNQAPTSNAVVDDPSLLVLDNDDERMDIGGDEASKAPQLTMDFSGNELPPQIAKDFDELLLRIADLEKFITRWIQISPAERASYFSDSLEEERMSLWIMNAVVSLGEVYCRLQGMNPWTEGIDSLKATLERYAFKFDELEPHSHLLSRTEGGPTQRLAMPAVKRFLKNALTEE